MKKNLFIVFQILFAIFVGMASRYISEMLDLPFMGNQLVVCFASYYLGIVPSLIIAVATGVIFYFMNPSSALFIFPALVGALITWFVVGKCKFLDKFVDTISALCVLGVLEGIALAIAEGFLLKGERALKYADNLMQLLIHKGGPMALSYVIVGVFSVYFDVTVSLLILWIVRYFRNPVKKRIERQKYLKRNMAGMIGFIILVVSLFSAFPLHVKAGNSNSNVQKIYSAKEGLAGGAANDIVQTSDGTIWVATYEGLYRFDGKNFELQTNITGARSVVCLYVGDDGSLWIGNNGTGLVVKTADNRILNLDIYDGMPSDTIRDIKQLDDGVYYVATSKGLVIVGYDGEKLEVEKVINDNQYINNLDISIEGIVAFYSSEKIVYLAKDGFVTQNIKIEGSEITSVVFDNNSNLYVGKGTNEIDIYANIRGKYCKLKTIETDEIFSVSNLYFDDEITYFAAKNGLGYIDGENNVSQIYVDGFDSSINKILKDYQGNFWFCSSRQGLLCLEKSVFSDVFSQCDVSECVTNTETQWQDLLYVGTDSGLLALDLNNGKTVENELIEKFGTNSRIRCLYVDKNNNLWISNYYGGSYEVTPEGEIYSYNSDDKNFKVGNKSRFVYELSDGTIILSHNGGLAFVKNHEVVNQLICGEKMSSAYALSLVQMNNGDLLVGTDGEGISVYNGDEVKRVLTRADGISSGVILRMVKDPYSNGAFILTGSGLCYLDEDYNAREITGFPYYNNLDMWIAGNDSVFVLTSAGVFVCSYESLMSEKASTILLDGSSGLKSSLTSNSWNYLSKDGKLYIAGNGGVYVLDVNHYTLQVNEYKPTITNITIDGKEVLLGSNMKLDIPAGSRKLSFDISINNFTSTNPNIRYYLSGVDKTKITQSSEKIIDVTYDDLSRGNYQFVIEVLDDNSDEVIAKRIIDITKESEEYEESGFLFLFYAGFAWIVISIIVSIFRLAIGIYSRRQRNNYEKVLAKLEREKAQALELALHNEEQANKSKSDFLASMSHEIRTPINAIIGMDTMILRESNQSSIRYYAQNVKSASETLLSLINDILDFSKIESGKMELVLDDYDPTAIIGDLINMVKPKAEAKELALKVVVDEKIPTSLYGDSVRIKQIILNILNNAVKYTEKGSIEMKIDSSRVDESQIALNVRIADTGIGIKQEDIKKLFSPYERIEENRNKNVEGTGLGMSITKSLLAMMNSSLCVDSVYGEGSCFSFTILQQVKSEETIGNYEERLKTIGNDNLEVEAFRAPDASVLVVDDVDMNLIVAENLLKRTRIKVTTASSGKDAVELAKSVKYDVILLDAMMPEMSGEETLKKIKEVCEINIATPVIVLTANAIKGAREEYLNAGFDNYLSKPIDGVKLEAMLLEYLPKDKIQKIDYDEEDCDKSATEENQAEDPVIAELEKIDGIDTVKGQETAGGQDTYLSVCKNFYDTGKSRIELIEKLYREMNLPDYTIQVHALKSSARLIGASELSEAAFEMEQAGRAEDAQLVSEKTDALIGEYRRIYYELEKIYSSAEDDTDKPEISEKKLKRCLGEVYELLDAFDFETARDLFATLEEYRMPEEFKGRYVDLKVRFAEIDRDGIVELIKEYL